MSRRPVGARGALPGVAVLTALFLGSLAVGLPGTPPAAGQEPVPVRRLGVGFSDEGVPRLTFSARDLADRPGVRAKLGNGLRQTVLMRAWARAADGGRTIALAARMCRITYDLWEEAWRVERRDPGGEATLRADGLAAVLDACVVARGFPVGTPSVWRRQSGRRVYFAVLFELNPLSQATVRRIRRWLTQPGGGGGLDRGEAFFGSFVALFVDRKVSGSEAELRFRSQEVPVP